MSSERWQRMADLFERAAELDPEARSEFLHRHCGDDTELLQAVSSLLDSDAAGDGFLGGPLAEQPTVVAAAAPDVEDGQRIGPYRLLHELGQGGMSTVYLAERDDQDFRRQVALKIIRRGMESPDTQRRLALERQILAGLEHPNIARLYDGGVTVSGLSYFAMEVVEGLPIDRYCDARKLGVRARIELFDKICAAVQYAHRSLVVHRDLKPGNILVDGNGEPKLLDFGIAKLLSPDLPAGGPELTAPWQRLITPNYASPEQVRGRPVTTASDVYSLGVLLYKLLTGALPHDLSGLSLPELERAAQGRSPTRPSVRVKELGIERARSSSAVRATRPEILRRQLEGDLDTIVLCALHPDPVRRYGSAEALADDLRNHLRGFPVRARADTFVYRSGKFLRRHAVAVATAGLFLLLLVGASLALAQQAARIRLERDQLREVVTFTEQVFDVAGEGEKLTVRQAVDRSARLLQKKLAGQPEVQATLRHTMGKLYLNLGAPSAAREQLEKAVELRRERFGEGSLDAAESLSVYSVALALDNPKRGQEAVAAARDAVADYRSRLGDRHPDLVAPLNNLVSILCFLGDNAAAAEPAEEALDLARQLLASDRLELANALTHRALLSTRREDHAGAVEAYGEALELLRRNLGDLHPEVTVVLSNLATAHQRLGDLDRAEELMRQTLELERQLYERDNSNLANTLFKLGSLLGRRGKIDESELLFRESLEMLRGLYGPGHYSVAVVTGSYAAELIRASRPADAEAALRQDLDAWRDRLAESAFLADAESLLGESLSLQGRFREAEPLLLASHRALLESRGSEASKTRVARQRLVELYEAWGRPDEAAGYRIDVP